jgi:hypothetical protein
MARPQGERRRHTVAFASEYGVMAWQIKKLGVARFEAMSENGRQLFAGLMRDETRGRGNGRKLQAKRKDA